MNEPEIQPVPSGEFRADPARYMERADRELVSLLSTDGRVFVTIGGLANLDEDEDDIEEDTARDAAS